ncbi:MAG: hypothetical protein ACTSP4_08090 [Candidatus Hodarchaeales archaeon]
MPRFSKQKEPIDLKNLTLSSWFYNDSSLDNIFFFFNQSISLLYNFNDSFQCEAVRGLWVVIEPGNKFWVTRVIERSSASLSGGPLSSNNLTYWEYSSKNGQLEKLDHKKSCNCDNESHLEDALNFVILTYLVTNRKGFLKKEKNSIYFIADTKYIQEWFNSNY